MLTVCDGWRGASISSTNRLRVQTPQLGDICTRPYCWSNDGDKLITVQRHLAGSYASYISRCTSQSSTLQNYWLCIHLDINLPFQTLHHTNIANAPDRSGPKAKFFFKFSLPVPGISQHTFRGAVVFFILWSQREVNNIRLIRSVGKGVLSNSKWTCVPQMEHCLRINS